MTNTLPRTTLAFCWLFADTTPEEGLPRLRAAGFEGVELWPRYLDAFGARRWADALARNQMVCAQLCPYFNFVAGPAELDQSRRSLASMLEAAAVLNCRRIRVFTGPPWGEGMVSARSASEEQWRATITGLREFCARAAQAGVEICIECHEGTLAEDSTSILRLVEGVGKPNLTLNAQLPLRHESWQESARRLGPYIAHMHLHNWRRGFGEGDLTFLASGAFDWTPCLRAIVPVCRPDLCLSVEHAHHEGQDDPWETAALDGPFLQSLRARLSPE